MTRFWWEQTSDYWEIPFYSEFGLSALPDRDDALAAREQLWGQREWEEEPGEDFVAEYHDAEEK